MQNPRYNFEVTHGSIMNHASGCLIQEPGVLMMIDTGSPIKIGEYEMCKNYLETIAQKLPADLVEGQYELIKFNVAYPEFDFQPEGYNFTIDEICTLFNYLQNFTIGEDGWRKFKSMSLDEMKAKLAQVATWLER